MSMSENFMTNKKCIENICKYQNDCFLNCLCPYKHIFLLNNVLNSGLITASFPGFELPLSKNSSL